MLVDEKEDAPGHPYFKNNGAQLSILSRPRARSVVVVISTLPFRVLVLFKLLFFVIFVP